MKKNFYLNHTAEKVNYRSCCAISNFLKDLECKNEKKKKINIVKFYPSKELSDDWLEQHQIVFKQHVNWKVS